jgi:hypothetical protein
LSLLPNSTLARLFTSWAELAVMALGPFSSVLVLKQCLCRLIFANPLVYPCVGYKNPDSQVSPSPVVRSKAELSFVSFESSMPVLSPESGETCVTRLTAHSTCLSRWGAVIAAAEILVSSSLPCLHTTLHLSNEFNHLIDQTRSARNVDGNDNRFSASKFYKLNFIHFQAPIFSP